MKMVLEFDLAEERQEAMDALDAGTFKGILWDVLETHIRSRLKYEENLSEEGAAALEGVRDFITVQLEESGVRL